MGVKLFIRGKRQITLTDHGIQYYQRANEMMKLLDKTIKELNDDKNQVAGSISIGCVETKAAFLLADTIKSFMQKYPAVQYELYNGDSDDIKSRLDSGILDIGILIEPVEAVKYDFIRLPVKERWGIIINSDHDLTSKESVSIEDIVKLPLILSRRNIVQDEIESWLEKGREPLNIIGTHNLLSNTLLLVEKGVAAILSIDGALRIRDTGQTKFIPLIPERTSNHVLVWKKNKILQTAGMLFIQQINENAAK